VVRGRPLLLSSDLRGSLLCFPHQTAHRGRHLRSLGSPIGNTIMLKRGLFLTWVVIPHDFYKIPAFGSAARINNHHPKVGIIFPSYSGQPYFEHKNILLLLAQSEQIDKI
jgi:hypothetical protein